MKQYVGTRLANGAFVSVVDLTTRCATSLDAGYRYVNHSPTGFEWGYGGSGPAQLAFAILLDFFGNAERARRFYQDFKWRAIATITTNSWEMLEEDVVFHIEQLEREYGMEAGSWANLT